MVYLDNAATTFPKPESVIENIDFCLKKYCGNPGRSGHALASLASEKIYDTREKVASHFGSQLPEGVVFTINATHAINQAIKGYAKRGMHVLCSDIEHNAVIRPLEKLKRQGIIDYSTFSTIGNLEENIRSSILPNTAMIVSTIASNVTGRRISISCLSRIATECGLRLIVDASQAAGHDKIDLTKTPCDCLCAPGHKGLFGIQGAGFAIYRRSEEIETLIEGGSGNNSRSPDMPSLLPERLEGGTLATPAIVALGSGIDFVNQIGLAEIESKISSLTDRMKSILKENEKITLYDSFGSVVLFNVKGAPESYVCRVLDRHGICVRGGLHCAPMAHKGLGTIKDGAVRVSFSWFNTRSDVDHFAKIINNFTAEM